MWRPGMETSVVTFKVFFRRLFCAGIACSGRGRTVGGSVERRGGRAATIIICNQRSYCLNSFNSAEQVFTHSHVKERGNIPTAKLQLMIAHTWKNLLAFNRVLFGPWCLHFTEIVSVVILFCQEIWVSPLQRKVSQKSISFLLAQQDL